MNRLAICPQRHVWSTGGAGAGSDELVCPVCGSVGVAAAADSTGTNRLFETLEPAAVPPVVCETTFVPAATPGASEDTHDDLPAVPGYDLLRELGRGGMGVVYAALHRELKRLVALKMIRGQSGADPEMRERFQREAQAVARLQHAGFVQIFDVGEHDGRPYLALEYIDGNNLDDETKGDPIAVRLAAGLIETLARTIHHAHEHGIVHRDLTPRNILLSRSSSHRAIRLGEVSSTQFEPKITDFGLAKDLDSDQDQTQTGVIMGSPNYMSPEQALGRPHDIGPATDVHALGTIFYKLLTGRPPFLSTTRLETLRQVVEIDPVPPTRLQPGIPRDVETICLKCLAKDPRQRYASARELADDLHRFLSNEPIRARPVPWRERAVKWSRRHPAASALIGLAVLSLATILGGGLVYNARVRGERDRAEKNLELAMRAVDEMLSEVGETQLAAEPRMEEKRKLLLARALALNQEFLKQKSGDSRVRLETARAYRRLADVSRFLEQHEQAVDAYGQAIALFARLHAEQPRIPELQQQLAYCHNFLGETLRVAGRRDRAETAYGEADRLLNQLCADFPESPDYRQDRARTLYSLGVLFREQQKLSESEAKLLEAAGLLSDLVQRFPQNAAFQQHLARACLNLGTVIRSADRSTEARSAYDRAAGLLQKLTAEYPDQPDYRFELAVTYNNAGNLLANRAEGLADAGALHRLAQSLFERLAVDFPKVPLYRQELANTWNSIGNIEALQGKPAETIVALNHAASLLEELLTQHPEVAAYQGDLGMVLGNIGLAYFAQSQLAEACNRFEQAVDRLQQTLRVNGDHAVYREFLRDNYQNLAEAQVVLGDHAAAAIAARALPEVFPESPQDRYNSACYLARCGRIAADDPRLGPEERQALARQYGDASLAALQQAVGQGFDDLPQLRHDCDSAFQAVAMRTDFQAIMQHLADKSLQR